MDKSTLQSTLFKENEQKQSSTHLYNTPPSTLQNKKFQEVSGMSSSTKVSQRKFLEGQDTYKRADLKIDVEPNHMKDSPVKQYIYNSLRSKEGVNPEIFQRKNNGLNTLASEPFLRNFSKESDM